MRHNRVERGRADDAVRDAARTAAAPREDMVPQVMRQLKSKMSQADRKLDKTVRRFGLMSACVDETCEESSKGI